MDDKDLQKFFYHELKYDINNLTCKIKRLPFENLKDIMLFIGIFENNNKKRQLVVPEITNIESFLINIHEYTHEVIYESNLENSANDYLEVVPITMERFFVTKYYHQYLKELNYNQFEKLKYYMTKQKHFYQYILAYYYQFILINKYNHDISKSLNYRFEDNNYNLNEIGCRALQLLKKETF